MRRRTNATYRPASSVSYRPTSTNYKPRQVVTKHSGTVYNNESSRPNQFSQSTQSTQSNQSSRVVQKRTGG